MVRQVKSKLFGHLKLKRFNHSQAQYSTSEKSEYSFQKNQDLCRSVHATSRTSKKALKANLDVLDLEPDEVKESNDKF